MSSEYSRRMVHESDSDGIDDDDSVNNVRPFEESFAQLRRSFKVSRLKGARLDLARRLNAYSLRYGYTNSQAKKVISIALRIARSSTYQVSLAPDLLLSSVKPAPQELFGSSVLILLLNALGGTANTGLDTTNENLSKDSSSYLDSDDDNDDSLSRGQDNLPIKKAMGIKVQLSALKLLLKLYAPPSLNFCIRSIPAGQSDSRAESYNRFRSTQIPKSFFTSKALKVLDKCYGVLFHHLEYETLRPTICHLLCLLTRRKHVRHYRIARILALRNKDPLDIPIIALINTYAAFYPDMLFAEIVTEKQAFVDSRIGIVHDLRYPDPSWLLKVYRIWSEGQNRSSIQVRSKKSSHDEKDDQGTSTFEILRTIAPPPSLLNTDETTISASEMTSFRELGYRIDRVEMPNEIASALGHKMTMLAVLSQSTSGEMERSFARMYEWTLNTISDEMGLHFFFLSETVSKSRSNISFNTSEALLEGLLDFVRLIGCCDRQMQRHLHRMLQIDAWKEFSKREKVIILKLIGFCIPKQCQNFQDRILNPLKKIAEQGDDDEVVMVLNCLENLINNCSKQNWQTNIRRMEEGHEIQWGTVKLSLNDDIVETMATMISNAVTLSSTLLCKRSNNIAVLHACLSLHEAIFNDSMIGLHDLLLPPNFVLYYPVFSPYGGVMSLSRQLGLVHTIRQMHENYLVAKENGNVNEIIALDGLPVPMILRDRRNNFFAEECSDEINDCVILLIDLVWRNNGFASIESGNMDIGLPEDFFINLSNRCANRGDELERIGSPSHSSSLAILMEAYANDLVRKRGAKEPVLHGPLTPSKLKEARKRNFPVMNHRDFRDSFLAWLSRYGAHGISDLLNATITRFIRGQEVDQSTVLG